MNEPPTDKEDPIRWDWLASNNQYNGAYVVYDGLEVLAVTGSLKRHAEEAERIVKSLRAIRDAHLRLPGGVMTMREQLIELIFRTAVLLDPDEAAGVLDALLSDEGRPLLRALLSGAEVRSMRVPDSLVMVEMLKERGVLVPIDTHITGRAARFVLRLPEPGGES